MLRRGMLGLTSILVLLVLALGVAAAAGADDRATAEAVLKEVDASPRREVATEMVARSRAALERAARLRASGDEPHARLADGLARTWAEAARDVVRAVEIEERAQAARRAATDAGAVAQRERALLEEGVAQSGRLRAQLDAVTREAKEQPVRTSTAATENAGAKKPAPKAPARDGGAP
ncbi:MAG: hypothetical protein KF819_12710 [Labilithrix sp.]|nr:hypothetical protein [Labilithrix sp.]